LFRVRVFGDFHVSSEDNIFGTLDVTTDALMNTFGLLDTPLKELESSA